MASLKPSPLTLVLQNYSAPALTIVLPTKTKKRPNTIRFTSDPFRSSFANARNSFHKQSLTLLSKNARMATGRQVICFTDDLGRENAVDEHDYLAMAEILLDSGIARSEVDRILKVRRNRTLGRNYIKYGYNTDRRVCGIQCSVLTPSVGTLQALRSLDLTGCPKLQSLPEEIGNLVNLERLTVYKTALRSLPSSIGRLRNLRELDLNGTMHLRYLPEEIGDLSNLIKFNLSCAMITSLPSSIGRLKSLKHLSLVFLLELTSLPEEIGNLPDLVELNLSRSRITSLPPSIGRLRSLQHLNLRHTWQLESLPEEIAGLRSLRRLNLCESKITSLPPSINFAIGCNIFRYKTATAPLTGENPTARGRGLPIVLANAWHLFRSHEHPRPVLEGLEQHDAIYHVLVEPSYRMALIEILADSRQARKP